jgi:tetratricopeptide (TPR) repeat protein
MSRIEKLQQMLKTHPDDVELRYMLAMELKSAGESDSALEEFDRCIQLNPLYAPAYFHKGNTLLELNQLDQARSVLRLGIEKATEGGDTHAASEMGDVLESLQ